MFCLHLTLDMSSLSKISTYFKNRSADINGDLFVTLVPFCVCVLFGCEVFVRYLDHFLWRFMLNDILAENNAGH